VEKLHELIVGPPVVSIGTLPFEPKTYSEEDQAWALSNRGR
jgi:hypothetical protein